MAVTTSPWRMLNTVRTINAGQETYTDPFDGTAMGVDWSHPGWTIDLGVSSALPTVGDGFAGLPAGGPAEDTRSALLVDQSLATQGFRGVAALDWAGDYNANFYLMMDMHDTTPVPTGGIRVRFQLVPPSEGISSLRLYIDDVLVAVKSYHGFPTHSGATHQSWNSRVNVDASNTIRVYWSSNSVPDIIHTPSIYNPPGGRVGFAFKKGAPAAYVYIDRFNLSYFVSSGGLPETALVGSSGGTVYYESTNGNMIQANSVLTTRSDKWISAAARLDKLYIADFGVRSTNSVNNATTATSTLTDLGATFITDGVDADDDMVEINATSIVDGTGTWPILTVDSETAITVTGSLGTGTSVGYRIMRSPKVFDTAALTLTRLTATAGFIPPDCKIVAACYDRLCWAGDANVREAVYMSKIGVPTNYSYGTNLIDEAFVYDPARVAGSPSIGDQVTALIPHLDDYLLIGCKRSIWIQRGDPALGAPPEAISREIGILQQSSWCYTPDNTIVAMTLDGLYLIEPSPQSVPMRLSRDRMPQELVNIDPNLYQVLVEYDTLRNGINIFVSPNDPGPTTHFWFGWALKEFSPESYKSDFEPTAMTSHAISGVGPRRVVYGCRDGYIRISEDSAKTDDGENFRSNVLIGPIMLGGSGYYDGMLREVVAQLAEDSGEVTLKIRVGDSIESAFRATSRVSYVMRAGKNRTWRPNLRGNACFLEMTSEGGEPWALEQMSIVRERLGKQRLLA